MPLNRGSLTGLFDLYIPDAKCASKLDVPGKTPVVQKPPSAPDARRHHRRHSNTWNENDTRQLQKQHETRQVHPAAAEKRPTENTRSMPGVPGVIGKDRYPSTIFLYSKII
jgi:hypothetical protein